MQVASQPAPVWTSLEIAKLLVSAVTPLLIVFLGWYINRALKRLEHFQWQNQKLIEKRLSIFDDIAPHFNDLLCYFTYVGCWKDLKPIDVVHLKRALDKKIFLAAPLFSPSFFAACTNFMNLCYQTYTGWGRDARLRTKFETRKQFAANWDQDWDELFNDEPSDPNDIRKAYQEIMRCFSQEIGLGGSADHFPTGRVPANIR